jgi:hypothetical protein
MISLVRGNRQIVLFRSGWMVFHMVVVAWYVTPATRTSRRAAD